MTFDEVLAQVLDLLQRQGRVSYGALKRRFALDDAYLDDLCSWCVRMCSGRIPPPWSCSP